MAPPLNSPSQSAPWSLSHRILFRFLCAYFLLYSLPGHGRVSIFNSIPASQIIWKPYNDLWHAICPWVGSHWFHLSGRPITYFDTGSGDTTLSYIQNFLILLLAAAAALLWSLLDHQRPNYTRLESWLRLLVRYTLAFTLFAYGILKVFPLQFRAPGFGKLIEHYGDFSPMGALWYFMGASTPYIIFSGVAELVPGLLLLFRRTTTLGALIAFAVLTNVMVLNYCYDVPVKLYSTNLVLMSIYLTSADLGRLFNFFLLNRHTEPADSSLPRFSQRSARMTAVAFQVAFVGFTLGSSLYGAWNAYQISYVHPKRPPIFGLYDVTRFTRNGQDVPPLTTDATRWRKVIAEFPNRVTVLMMNDVPWPFTAAYNDDLKTLTLSYPGDPSKTCLFTYSRATLNSFNLEGTIGSDHLSLHLREFEPSKFLLLNRGFHWINEQAFNR
jgi:uncharacterized membrane protein YphA (DoxX/SURF4 family)